MLITVGLKGLRYFTVTVNLCKNNKDIIPY